VLSSVYTLVLAIVVYKDWRVVGVVCTLELDVLCKDWRAVVSMWDLRGTSYKKIRYVQSI